MNVSNQTPPTTTVAARIAGEDILPGDFVTVLNEIVEFPSYLWSGSSISLQHDEPIQLRYMPQNAGAPLKVVSICLPFVYAKRPKGNIVVCDTRQQQLVRLDRTNGRNIWKRLRKSLNKKKHSSKTS